MWKWCCSFTIGLKLYVYVILLLLLMLYSCCTVFTGQTLLVTRFQGAVSLKKFIIFKIFVNY